MIEERQSEKGNELQMLNLLKQLHTDESGQDIIEYVLVAAIITVGAMTAIKGVGTQVNNLWTSLNTTIATT
jgi:Flp pilus assembly pilin Flp